MIIRIDAVSDVGLVRSNNEDMALVQGGQLRDEKVMLVCELPEQGCFSAIVADGIGGYDKGEVASEMATNSFDHFLNKLPEGKEANDIILALKQWCQQTNADILAAAAGSGMGCTLTGIFTYWGMAFLVNIGDSRTYRYRNEYLKQMTNDHSERNRTDDDSVPSNLIYNALGVPEAFIDVQQTKLIEGDIFLICSDGLTDMITDEEIECILARGGGAEDLVQAAKNAGGLDNITVIVLNVS